MVAYFPLQINKASKVLFKVFKASKLTITSIRK